MHGLVLSDSPKCHCCALRSHAPVVLSAVVLAAFCPAMSSVISQLSVHYYRGRVLNVLSLYLHTTF